MCSDVAGAVGTWGDDPTLPIADAAATIPGAGPALGAHMAVIHGEADTVVHCREHLPPAFIPWSADLGAGQWAAVRPPLLKPLQIPGVTMLSPDDPRPSIGVGIDAMHDPVLVELHDRQRDVVEEFVRDAHASLRWGRAQVLPDILVHPPDRVREILGPLSDVDSDQLDSVRKAGAGQQGLQLSKQRAVPGAEVSDDEIAGIRWMVDEQ